MTEQSPETRVAITEVDDVIEAAANAHAVEAETLSVEELQDVARQLDIPTSLVVPAIAKVRKRRADVLAADVERAQRAAARLRYIAAGAALLVLMVVVAMVSARADVRSAWSRAEKHRAQVLNVRERQRATKAQWADVADSPRKHAELTGAENRVRVEQKNYDAAAVAYNDAASGPLAHLVVVLGDYPESVSLSSEMQW
ncbi:MAG: hypothetical protein AB1Z98_23080 [Nannocystaceae bacterium]